MTDNEKKIAMAMMMIQAPQTAVAVTEAMSFRFTSTCPNDVVGDDEMKWLRAFPKRRPATTAWLAFCFGGALAGELVLLAARLAGA